ncbi:MAG TPA: hypothetical protein VFY28_00865 [Candidatus Paceibacterota bacterium]|nr:hypothetical protein [Candidatus Paceibacterota bacterium]
MHTPKTIIFYHGSGCTDGFGAAYAAWKKFGDAAEYHPLSRGEEPPVEHAEGAEVYFVDFTYEKEMMDRFIETSKSVTVLDHHAGVKDVIESMPNHVYDAERSGAGITWDYFHPGLPRPKLIDHVEDDDLFRFALPDTREIITYLEVQPQEFDTWDDIARKLDAPSEREAMLERARIYREYFEILVKLTVDHAKLVLFEGYEVYFASAPSLKSLKSLVGNQLATKQGPFGLVVSAHPNGYGVSIRGDGSVDVAKIAQKFGGNGHPSAAGFLIPREGPFPWELIESEEE